MVSVLPYHKRYHSDALSGMMPLTLEERGAYNTILDLIYDRGGPLIDNERLLAGYMNCSIRKWRQLREILLEKGKIRIDADGLIHNRRAKKEIENTSKTHRKLIEAGAKGGRKRVENEKKDNENSEEEQASLEPALSDPQAILEARSQSSEDKESSGGRPPANGLFDVGLSILKSAGESEKNARSLIGKWRKAKGEADVMAGLLECRDQRIANPVEWLEKRFVRPRYVSSSGYEYRGNVDDVIREAERRSDWGTFWKAKGDRDGRLAEPKKAVAK